MAKALGWGAAGFILKWALGRLAGRASDIRAALALIEQVGRDADRVMRSNMAGAPDHGGAATVIADRRTVIVRLRRALGHADDFALVERAHEQFALSLRLVDPHFGQAPTDADVELMRDAETALHNRVCAVARRDWAWKLFAHERGK